MILFALKFTLGLRVEEGRKKKAWTCPNMENRVMEHRAKGSISMGEQETLAATGERKDGFQGRVRSGASRLYIKEDVAGRDYASDLGLPREYPSPAVPIRPCIVAVLGPADRSLARALPTPLFPAYVYCIEPVSQSPLTGFTLGGQTDSSVYGVTRLEIRQRTT